MIGVSIKHPKFIINQSSTYYNVRVLFYICITAILLSSCMNEQQVESEELSIYDGPKYELGISLQPREGEVKNDINTLRVLVYASSSKKLIDNILLKNDEANLNIKVKAAPGNNNFYFICNETAEMTKVLAPGIKESEVEKIKAMTADVKEFIPMYAKKENVNVVVGDDGTVTIPDEGGTDATVLGVKLTRLFAKLSMTVIKNLDASADKFTIEKMTYKIYRVPKYTLIKENEVYAETTWADDISAKGVGKITDDGEYDADYNVTKGQAITFSEIYLPEHILSAKENRDLATYMVVAAQCKLETGGTLVDVVYNVQLGNNPPSDLDITRSVHYKIYAKIKNLGAMGFRAEIVPMTDYDIPVSWKPFEGYDIVDERLEEYGTNKSIWNNYSQFSGILKISKNKVYSSALFRYGSVVALTDVPTGGAFNATTDMLWKPGVTNAVTAWGDIGYITSGNVGDAEHTLENIKQGKGDPCRLVGLTESEIANGVIDNGAWRLPTKDQMEWIKTARNEETTNSKGFYSFAYLLTPNTGYRSNDGALVPASGGGRYWSSTDKQSFIFKSSDNTGTFQQDDAQQAYAIRCIRTERHPSNFEVGYQAVDYKGSNSMYISQSYNNNLVPYFKVIQDTSDGGNGFTITKKYGTKSDNLTYKVSTNPTPYDQRKSKVKIIGYGLDGVVHELNTELIQQRLVHNVTIALDTELTFENGYWRVPKEGKTLEFTVSMVPTTPFEPYLTTYPYKNMLWKINGYSYTDVPVTFSGVANNLGKTFQLVIPANTWHHVIGIDVYFTNESSTYFPFLHINKMKLIQDAATN